MIVYNVTVKIDQSRADEWLAWMRREHIPEVVGTGMFVGYRLLRIMDDEAAEEGMTYAVQYTSAGQGPFDKYLRTYAADLQQKHKERFGGSYVAIRTLMQVVEERTLFASES